MNSALHGLSPAKLARIFTGRANELQLISNLLDMNLPADTPTTNRRAFRKTIADKMAGKPISMLDQVGAEVLHIVMSPVDRARRDGAL